MWNQLRTGLGLGLVVLGAALGTYWLAVEGYSLFEQHRLGGRLGSLRGTSRIASPVVVARATRDEANAEGLVGRIEIPRIGMNVVVLDGDDDATLSRGVGHVPHTAFPGEKANAVLAGHRDSYFRSLHALRRGDAMKFVTPDGTFTYAVDTTLIVKPDRTDLLAPGSTPRVTLVTCYPFHWIGPAPRRFIVQGHWVPQGPRLASEIPLASPQVARSADDPGPASDPPTSASPAPATSAQESRVRPPRQHRPHAAASRPAPRAATPDDRPHPSRSPSPSGGIAGLV